MKIIPLIHDKNIIKDVNKMAERVKKLASYKPKNTPPAQRKCGCSTRRKPLNILKSNKRKPCTLTVKVKCESSNQLGSIKQGVWEVMREMGLTRKEVKMGKGR